MKTIHCKICGQPIRGSTIKKKYGKIGAPKSAKRKRFLARIRRKRKH